MAESHPTYEALPRSRQYDGGSLGGLWALLKGEVGQEATTTDEVTQDTGWRWRALPRGALVALRRRHDLWNRLELRIARFDAPTSPAGWRAWTAEVMVFLSHFAIRPLDGETPCTEPGREWFRVPNQERDEGKAAVRLQELREAEVKPGRAICHDCLQRTGEVKEIEWYPGARIHGQRCPIHALEAGRRLLNGEVR